jgi:hypothetical protein
MDMENVATRSGETLVSDRDVIEVFYSGVLDLVSILKISALGLSVTRVLCGKVILARRFVRDGKVFNAGAGPIPEYSSIHTGHTSTSKIELAIAVRQKH